MIFDFTFEEVMRLSSIKRWGIIEMSRDQSVAEHSYNVAMIGAAIVDNLPLNGKPASLRESVVNWAMVHDLTELVSGDVPTPMKPFIGESIEMMEYEMFPEFKNHKELIGDLVYGLVKIADFIDAIQFAEKFCVDTRKTTIIDEMIEKLYSHLDKMELAHKSFDLKEAVRSVWIDAKTSSRRPF